MMRRIVAFMVALVVFWGFFSPAYPATFPRHKNPAEIQEEKMFPLELIFLYGEVVKLQVEGRWDEASVELKRTFLSYIPDELRYIFARLNQLIENVADKLKEVDGEISSAEALLRYGDTEEAGKIVEDSWMTLLKAEREVGMLHTSVDELGGRIGVGVAERLRDEIAPLGVLVDEYKKRIGKLYAGVQEGKKGEFSFLEIAVQKRKVFVGGSFEVFGTLRGEDGRGLDDRSIDIFLENEKISEALTERDGEFTVNVDFPFLYKKTATVFASFSPKGEDEDRLYPSISNKVVLEPYFYTPVIEADYEQPVYPVLPFTLQGKIRVEDAGLAGYPVRLQVGQQAFSTHTDEEGKFKMKLSFPSGEGKSFPLIISTPAEGMIAPARLRLNIPLSYKMPKMVVDMPWVVVAPFALEVRGKVFLEDDFMEGARIRVTGEKKEIEAFLEKDTFRVSLSVPLFRFSGWEKIKVLLSPREGWIASVSMEKKVLVVNPVMFFPFAVLLFVFVRVSRKKEEKIGEAEKMQKKERIKPAEKVEEKKEMHGLVRIYHEAVEVVANLCGVRQMPGHTIREYVRLVKMKLGDKGKDFEFVSFITEKFLYAKGWVSEKEEKKAKDALARLKK
ncbi:hypothetical protein IBX65_06755 [Candidatus Aerophobetes bacterium]|nr:hypothetical protein [Candidatus Aerophobetes bacterium]